MKKLLCAIAFILPSCVYGQNNSYDWDNNGSGNYRLNASLNSFDKIIVFVKDSSTYTTYSDSIIFTVLTPGHEVGDQQYFVTTDAIGQLLRTPKTSIPEFFQPGFVIEYAGTTAPAGFLMCDGSAVSRTTYANLFSVTSTAYGPGDGSTTFNLPNTNQRFPLGKATSGTGSVLGSTGGDIDHVHTVNPPNTATGMPSGVSGQLVGVINVASETHTHNVDIAQFNSGTSNPPYVVFNYIIKY